MKHRATIGTRILRLAPAILQAILGPSLCMAMVNIPLQPHTGLVVAMGARDPIPAVYAGILFPIHPIDSLDWEHPCIAASGLNQRQFMNGAVREHVHPFNLLWEPEWNAAAETRNLGFGANRAQKASRCSWGAHRAPNLGIAFNAIYGVNGPWGMRGRRIPKLIPSYWDRLAPPFGSSNDAPHRTDRFSNSRDTAKLRNRFEGVPIADQVKAGFFELVAWAEDGW